MNNKKMYLKELVVDVLYRLIYSDGRVFIKVWFHF